MKKKGWLLLLVVISIVLSVSIVEAPCCSNPDISEEDRCMELESMNLGLCCPEGSEENCQYEHYSEDVCEILFICNENLEQNCCLVESGNGINTCFVGTCLEDDNNYVGEQNVCSDTICETGCCCKELPNDENLAYNNVAKFFCDEIDGEFNMGINNQQDCLIFCNTLWGSGDDFCGDGVLQEGEECEKIDDIFPDNCKSDCTCEEGYIPDGNKGCELSSTSVCGDGIVDEGEECDSGDNCQDDCLCEEGYRPVYEEGVLTGDCEEIPFTCGDGIVDEGEECDSGDNCQDDCLCEEGYTSDNEGGCVEIEVIHDPEECPTGAQDVDANGCSCTYFFIYDECTCVPDDPSCGQDPPVGCSPTNQCLQDNPGMFCNNEGVVVQDCNGGGPNTCGCPEGYVCQTNGLCKPIIEQGDLCKDGIDNDNDGATDCDDLGCHMAECDLSLSGEDCKTFNFGQGNKNLCCMNPKDCDGDGVFDQCGGTCEECTNIEGTIDITHVLDIFSQPKLEINFNVPSTCINKLEKYEILRCEADIGECMESSNDDLNSIEPCAGLSEKGLQLDEVCKNGFQKVGQMANPGSLNDLVFFDELGSPNFYANRTYCYKVKGIYITGASIENEGVVCETVAPKECITSGYPNKFCVDDKIGECNFYLDNEKATLRIEQNDCEEGDCISNPYSNSNEAVCFKGQDDFCMHCNLPLGAFGLLTKSIAPDYQLDGYSYSQVNCENTSVCYYDEQPISTDAFDDCIALKNSGLGCYGYSDNNSCTSFDGTYNNKCLQRNCSWNWINKEFSVGVCIEQEEELQKCELCSGDYYPQDIQKQFDKKKNHVFGACTVSTCNLFGNCFPKDSNGDGIIFDNNNGESCVSYANANCKTYNIGTGNNPQTKDYCINSDVSYGTNESKPSNVSIDIKGDEIWTGTNRYTNHSFDYLGLGFCKFIDEPNKGCINDPDNTNENNVVGKDKYVPFSQVSVSPIIGGSISDFEISLERYDTNKEGSPCEDEDICLGFEGNDAGTYVSLVSLTNPINNNASAMYFNDSTKNNFHGLISGAKYNKNGFLNGAYYFNRSLGNFIIIDSKYPDVKKGVTFSVWINTSTREKQSIIERISDISAGPRGVTLGIDGSGKVYFRFRTDDTDKTVLFDDLITVDVWNHVVGTLSEEEICIYLNNVQSCNSIEGMEIKEGIAVNIGRREGDPGHFFNGFIDEIGVWNRSLTLEEVGGLYNDGEGLSFDSLSSSLSDVYAYYKGDVDVVSICYDYLACKKCSIDRQLYDNNNNFYITSDLFEGVCADQSPGTEWFNVSGCPSTACYNYPQKKVNSGDEIKEYFSEYPGGDYVFYYYSKDEAGHMEEVKRTNIFNVDSFPPKIWLDPEYQVLPGNLPDVGSDDQIKSNVTISFKTDEYAYCWHIMNPLPKVDLNDLNDFNYDNNGLLIYDSDDLVNSFSASQWGGGETFEEYIWQKAWNDKAIETVNDLQTVYKFEDFPDGIYDYTVGCEDVFGNRGAKNFRIRVKADTRIAEVSPLVPVNQSRINLTVVTRNNVSCSLFSGAFEWENGQIIIPEANITLNEESGYELYEHRVEVDLQEQKEYIVNVTCDYLPIATDTIKFTFDQLPPITLALNDAGDPYNFDLWKQEYYGIELRCRDFPLGEPFGCNIINYCIDTESCDPDAPLNSFTGEEPLYGYVSERMTIPRYFCYSSQEKSDVDYIEFGYDYLNTPQGGLKEETICHYIYADEIEPEIKISLLENHTSFNYPYAPSIWETDIFYNFLINGTVNDWDYDTKSEKIDLTLNNGKSWNPLTKDNTPSTYFALREPWWDDNSPTKTKEGYVFDNFLMNVSFDLLTLDKRPNFLYFLFRGKDDENFYSATIDFKVNDMAQIAIHKKVNDGNLVNLGTSQNTFEMVDEESYDAVIEAIWNDISFKLYKGGELLATVNSDDNTYSEGYIGAGISRPLNTDNSETKVEIKRVYVDSYTTEQDNYISWRTLVDDEPLHQLNTKILDQNETNFRINMTLNHNSTVHKFLLRGFDKAENMHEQFYYVYLDRNGPFFEEFVYSNGNSVNESGVNYELYSSEEENLFLFLYDTDYYDLHINVTNVSGNFYGKNYEFNYMDKLVTNSNPTQFYVYKWNVTINTTGIPAGIHGFEIIAQDQLGNSNTTIYNLNFSDTIPPEFDINIYRDENKTELLDPVEQQIGFGLFYVTINASEPSTIHELKFNTSFNSQIVDVICENIDDVKETWDCIFNVPYLNFWGKEGYIEFIFNASDPAGNEQDYINQNVYGFNGVGPNYVFFDPSFNQNEHSSRFYHNIYPDKLKYYGEVKDDLSVFITPEESLFISGYSLGSDGIELLIEGRSTSQPILETEEFEGDAILTYKRYVGNSDLKFDGDLSNSGFSQVGNYIGFINDNLLRIDYQNYGLFYEIISFYHESGISNIEISPALEFDVSAGEVARAYNIISPSDYFGLHSPLFEEGYNEFFAKSTNEGSFSTSPHYYILFDNKAPFVVEGDYYPSDGMYVNNYNNLLGDYDLKLINITFADPKYSSKIFLENTNIKINYQGQEVYNGVASYILEDEDDLNVYYKIVLLLDEIQSPYYINNREDGGDYQIEILVSDGAGNEASFEYEFYAYNGVVGQPFLTLIKDNERYNNSFDIYPFPNVNYFVPAYTNYDEKIKSDNVDFELKFKDQVNNLQVTSTLDSVSCQDVENQMIFRCSFTDMFANQIELSPEIIHVLNISYYTEDDDLLTYRYLFVVDSKAPIILNILHPEFVTPNASGFDADVITNLDDESFPIRLEFGLRYEQGTTCGNFKEHFECEEKEFIDVNSTQECLAQCEESSYTCCEFTETNGACYGSFASTVNVPESITKATDCSVVDMQMFAEGVAFPPGEVNLRDVSLPENLSEGTYELILTLTDQAGNKGTKTSQFYVDNTPPELEITSLNVLGGYDLIFENNQYKTNGEEINFVVTSNEQLEKICFSSDLETCSSNLMYIDSMTAEFNAYLFYFQGAEIENEFVVKAWDLAGNVNEYSFEVVADRLGPGIEDIYGDLTYGNPLYVKFKEKTNIYESFAYNFGDDFITYSISQTSNIDDLEYEYVRNQNFENGTYYWFLNVSDQLGNIRYHYDYEFEFSGDGFNINLSKPSYGWSSTEVFDIEIETNFWAQCKFDYLSNVKSFDFMEFSFESEDGLIHVTNAHNISEQDKIYVICKDEYNSPHPSGGNKRFDFIYDPYAPIILEAKSDPSIVIDEVDGNYATEFILKTDKNAFCRYDYGNDINNYTLMSSENSWPGMGVEIGNNEFEHRVIINDQFMRDTYRYNISCISLADVVSLPEVIEFMIDPSYGLIMEIISPVEDYVTSDPEEDIIFTLETNKGASCLFAVNDSSTSYTFSTIANTPRTINLGSFNSKSWNEGWMALGVVCEAEDVERSETRFFGLDTNPPSIVAVETKEIVCVNDRVDIENILWEGLAPLHTVEYKLVRSSDNVDIIDWRQTTKIKNIRVDKDDEGEGLNLSQGTTYYFAVRANNTVLNEMSNIKNSDSILVDSNNEECAYCGDGKCDSDESCSTCPADCGTCVPQCKNGVKDGSETDVDCGGTCPKCDYGKICLTNSDCVSGSCENGLCALPLCENNRLDEGETDVDCGGVCDPCGIGSSCKRDSDCAGDSYCNDQKMCVRPALDEYVSEYNPLDDVDDEITDFEETVPNERVEENLVDKKSTSIWSILLLIILIAALLGGGGYYAYLHYKEEPKKRGLNNFSNNQKPNSNKMFGGSNTNVSKNIPRRSMFQQAVQRKGQERSNLFNKFDEQKFEKNKFENLKDDIKDKKEIKDDEEDFKLPVNKSEPDWIDLTKEKKSAIFKKLSKINMKKEKDYFSELKKIKRPEIEIQGEGISLKEKSGQDPFKELKKHTKGTEKNAFNKLEKMEKEEDVFSKLKKSGEKK